nr:flocculation protein FLO11-like isoform X2 [Chelonoidis abingdonii]
MGGPEAGHRVPVAALLTILASALLIPETVSLRCHSHSSVLLRDRGGKPLDSIITPNGTESCAPAHRACMEAAVTLSAGGMSMTLIQRGCRAGHPKGGTEPPTAPSRFLHIQADVRYCQSDQCNAKGLGLGSPGQGTAPAPSGPTQCYAGLSLSPQPHTLEQVTCDGDDARCYHGNGTLTAATTPSPTPRPGKTTDSPGAAMARRPRSHTTQTTTQRPAIRTKTSPATTTTQRQTIRTETSPATTTTQRQTIRTETSTATTARSYPTPATRGTCPTAPAPAPTPPSPARKSATPNPPSAPSRSTPIPGPTAPRRPPYASAPCWWCWE